MKFVKLFIIIIIIIIIIIRGTGKKAKPVKTWSTHIGAKDPSHHNNHSGWVREEEMINIF